MACPNVPPARSSSTPGARPTLTGNVFQGVLAESLTGLTPAERAAVRARTGSSRPMRRAERRRTSVRAGGDANDDCLQPTRSVRDRAADRQRRHGAGVPRASTRASQHRVALRLVPLGRDREAREILEAERWGAQLQQEFSGVCPLVPRVYEHGELPDYFFVAMEYLDGENLSDVIGRGPDPAGAGRRDRAGALRLSRGGARASRSTVDGRPLRSLLHGDLKPRNVRVTSSGQIKVLDFGMAKALSLSRKVTRTDFGTLGYMSPERLESGEMDAQSDFWALGVILYQMVSGTPPFAAPDTRRLERLIVSRRPPPRSTAFCRPGAAGDRREAAGTRAGAALSERGGRSRGPGPSSVRRRDAGAAGGLAGTRRRAAHAADQPRSGCSRRSHAADAARTSAGPGAAVGLQPVAGRRRRTGGDRTRRRGRCRRPGADATPAPAPSRNAAQSVPPSAGVACARC